MLIYLIIHHTLVLGLLMKPLIESNENKPIQIGTLSYTAMNL